MLAPYSPRGSDEATTESHGETNVDDEENQPGWRTTAASEAELSESQALRDFFRSTSMRGWHRHGGWSTASRDAPQVRLDEFEGVRVGRWGRIDQIRLSQNNITGISGKGRKSFGMLMSSFQYLTVLDLSRNSLTGHVPAQLAELPVLEQIDLHGNNFIGAIPAKLGHLRRLKRLRLSENKLSGTVPEEVRNMATLELLDCSNNWLRDLLPAWACMGAVHAEAGDPYPAKIYLFVMAAAPNKVAGASVRAHEAQTRLRATELIRWHLDTTRQPLVLGQTHVRLVALPQHKEATVQFEVNLDRLAPRVIVFGPDGAVPKSVFSAVVDAPSIWDFPHEVVETSGVRPSTVQIEGQHGSVENTAQASPRPLNGLIALESDVRFADAWEENVRLNDNCCYNVLWRFGFRRALNRLIVLLLIVLLMLLFWAFGSHIGYALTCFVWMYYLFGLNFECIFRHATGNRGWARMPVLSFVVREMDGARGVA